MNDQIRVYVVDYGRHRNLVARYTNPQTGKKATRSTGTRRRKEAERFAAKWEAELQEGRYKSPSKVTWAEFRVRYEDEVLSGLADDTAGKVAGVFNAIEQHINPQLLGSLTAGRISFYQSKLRDAGRAETTIKGHMAHLQAALNWASRVGLLNEVPSIDMPRRAKSSKLMKGRPITGEEFDRMIEKVAKGIVEVRPDDDEATTKTKRQRATKLSVRLVESWRYYLRGLWWSGLRLEESLMLTWDDHRMLRVDLSGKYPMLHIPAELEKGNKDRLLPIAPEFCEFLLATPEAERMGFVFAPLARRVKGPRLQPHRVGEVVSDIGRAAAIKVHTDPRTGKVKHASAHDLRRSFGERWAPRVMPQVLMQLMRHESIETTLKFYVGRNAETTAETLWDAVSGNTSGNRAAESSSANAETHSQAVGANGLKE
jgi:integrase